MVCTTIFLASKLALIETNLPKTVEKKQTERSPGVSDLELNLHTTEKLRANDPRTTVLLLATHSALLSRNLIG